MRNSLGGSTSNGGVLKRTLTFLWKNKFWWIVPLIVTLLLLGLIVIMALTSDTKPFVYPQF